jgi:hypothetical protein
MKTEIEAAWHYGADENIWNPETGSKRKPKKRA